MPVAVSEEHEELRRTVERWLAANCPPAVAREAMEAEPEALPPVWKDLAAQGWLGLHVPEAHGGQGFAMVELAVTLEELAAAMVPGPVLPTVVVAAVLARAGRPDQQAELLPGLADGSVPAGLSLRAGSLDAAPGAGGGLSVSGSLSAVMGAPTARLILAPLADRRWVLLDAGPGADGLTVAPAPSLDATRPLGTITLVDVPVPAERVLPDVSGLVADLALVAGSAECAGGARWCLQTASDYAKVRVQFGRPIGQFQAIKHKLADMLVSVEQTAATAWDAARAWDAPADDGPAAEERSLAASVAGAVALDAFADAAKECVQILGGIGFTWEHDAHLYLKRAMATRQLLGEPRALRRDVCTAALAGVRRSLADDLPPEADAVRAELAPLIAEIAGRPADERRAAFVETGLLAPHWPRPWGRDAGPLEQLVADDELRRARLTRPHLGIGAWVLPTLIAHGSAEQQERWVGPTLQGDVAWCQLFSEPGAGSDLASLRMRAERVDGGWHLTGQKVWTSLARDADFGICLARTDATVPKHEGITYFVVDMATPGIDVRPLRELTGAAMFNEVFFDAVFVPDDCVVGRPGQGWRIGRTTLANERVSMATGATFGAGVESVLRRLGQLGADAPPGADVDLGELIAEAQSLRVMGQRVTLRTLSGLDPGSAASVRKLVGVEHEQRVQETGLSLCGPTGATLEGEATAWGNGFLATRCLTIAGGTSEVQRNVIAERLLGQPKDPEPGS